MNLAERIQIERMTEVRLHIGGAERQAFPLRAIG